MTTYEVIEQLTKLKHHVQIIRFAQGTQDEALKKDIEAIEIAIKQLGKEIPKKVEIEKHGCEEVYVCPNCEQFLRYVYADEEQYFSFCDECGQSLDWN